MRWTYIFFFVFLTIPCVITSNVTTDDSSDPLISGLEPFFKLTNGFIKLIYPESIVNFMLGELNIDIDKISTMKEADDAFEDLQDSLTKWQKPVKFFTPILVCITFGLISIVVMLFTGFILCCTCCCRKCCCQDCTGYPSSKDRACRGVCGVLFFLFVTMLLAGSILGFLANKAIHNQLDPHSSDGAISQIKRELMQVDSYMDSVLDDVDAAIDKILVQQIKKLEEEISELPKAVEEKFRFEANITELSNDVQGLFNRMKAINDGLTFFEKKETKDKFGTLKTQYINLKGSCSGCPDFKSGAKMPDLNIPQPQISKVFKGLQDTIQGNFFNGTQNVTDNAAKDMEKQTVKLIAEVEKVKSSVQSRKDQLKKNYKHVQKPLKDVIVDLEDPDTLKTVDTIRNVIFYVGIGLCGVGALICLLYYLGLLSGICGAPANEQGTCNRSVGANFLVSGITFTFIFFEILMIVLIILFVIGTFFRGEICDPLTPKIEESDTIGNLNKLVKLGMLRSNTMNLTIDLKDTMQKCKENKPVYEAINLENIINLRKILNFTSYDFSSQIQNAIDSIKAKTNPSVTIWNADMEDAYKGIQAISFNLVDTGADWKDPVELDKLEKQSGYDLFKQWRNDYEKFQNELKKHDEAIRNAKPTDMKNDWTNLRTKAQDLQVNLPKVSKNIVVSVVEKALLPFIDFTQNTINILIENILGLGKCRKLYHAIQGAVDTLCPKTIDPYNSFWFSLGWQLFFMIPAFIVAVVLNTYYRKDEDDDEEGFEDYKPYSQYTQHENAAYNPHPTSPHHPHPPPSYHQQYSTPPNAPAHYNSTPNQFVY